ncbi:MAG: NUDIX hydrolase [Gammaproteobacteria bacterium]|nr:NUDIX hydrolase [Gammaproteobacteria bacterium]
MKFCHHCGGSVLQRIPDGDEKLRYCCDSCDVIFYQNPKNIVGTLPIYENKVLLCKRAIEPRYGKWTLPAGFMENGETTLAGAVRETSEEAGARVIVRENSLYTLFNLPYINQVYLFFRAELEDLDFDPGIESLEVALFKESEIPWDEIAFPVVRSTLEYYFRDLTRKQYPVRMFDIHYDEQHRINTHLISSSH